MSDVDNNPSVGGTVKPETVDHVNVGGDNVSGGRDAGYTDHYWSPHYTITTPQYHTNNDHLQVNTELKEMGQQPIILPSKHLIIKILFITQEGEDDSGEVVVPDQDMSTVSAVSHYRGDQAHTGAGPIRGYPATRSDAFVWRPY